MNRKEIELEIDKKQFEIITLQNYISELKIQAMLLCDESQQYYEKEVNAIIHKKNPLTTEKQLWGFIKWIEYSKNINGSCIPIKRNKLVRINGKWI